jgi:hypothetical protein
MAPDWPRQLREDGDSHRAGIRVRKQAETIQRGDDVTQQRGRSRRNGSEGVRATERLLEHTFSRFGIQKIDALGKPFDPTLHEAMMEVDDPSQPPGTVVRVAEDGYKIHDRLVRPARVFVVKRNPKPEPSSQAQVEEAEAEFDYHSTERSS